MANVWIKLINSKPILKDFILTVFLASVYLFLYLYRLTEITPGVWGDEISLGWMINELKNTQGFVPFVTHNYGHPTLLIYLSSLVVDLFGKSVWSLRLVSVVFGALSVGAFYLWLRLFFSRFQATLGSIIYGSSYGLIIVSRFAYEVSAAMFFFILSGYFVTKYYQKSKLVWIVCLALCLGVGIYTYLGFRTVLIIFLLLLLVLFWHKKAWLHGLAFFVILILLLSPLLKYSYQNPGALNARTKSLSVFHQDLPNEEIVKELGGATFRTLTLFLFTPDPNPRQNPANSIVFDYLTVGLFFYGLIVLAKKQKQILVITLLFLGAILGAEIITLEKIPEFHYYGLGHPNTLRIALIVPLVVTVALFGLVKLSNRIHNKHWQKSVLVIFAILISLISLNRYFNQKLTPWIYQTNFVPILKIIDYANTNFSGKRLYLSQSLFSSQHLQYLLLKSIRTKEFKIEKSCQLESLKTPAILATVDLQSCSQDLIQGLVNRDFKIAQFISPWKQIEALLIESR